MEMEVPAPPVAVMPAANNSRSRSILLTVCLWVLLNAAVFFIVVLIADHTPCTTSTWVFRCLTLTDTAAKKLSALLFGGLCCATVAELSAMLHMGLSCGCGGRWAGAAVDALAWVALVATAGVHCMEVASGSIGVAAHPEDDTYFYVDVVLASVGLVLDLLAIGGLLLCCSPRRRKLGEQGAGAVEQV